jgi:hypothetical protein
MKRKAFDCVQMKWDIQRRIMEEFADVSPDEARRIQREQIEADPILGPFLRRVRSRKSASPSDQG